MVYVLSTSNRRFGLVAVHAWYWRFASHGLRVRLAPLDSCVAASIPIPVSAPPLATKHHYLHFEAVSSSIDSNPDQDMNSSTIPQPKNSKSVSNHHHFRKCADSFVPHIFVWGSCFWFCIPPSVRLLPSSLVLAQLVHTQLTHNLLTHNLSTHKLLTHNLSTHNLLTHNLLTHNLLTHTHNLSTHNLLTHNLLTHNLLTHNLLTHNLSSQNLSSHNLLTHNLSSQNLSSHNLLSHNLLTQNLSTHNLLTHNWRSLCVACVALTALGRLWWCTGFPNDAADAAALCVAGVALGDIDCHFAWQAWHLATWTFTLRGRRGTWRHIAHLALGDIDCHFAWQAWHLAAWTFILRGKRGTYGTGPALVAHRVPNWAGSGGAPGSQMTPWTPRLFAWQAWHLVTSTVTLRGRPGTWQHGPSLCVAGVALGDISLTWHLVTSTVTLCGRRGTWRHGPSLCLAGVALTGSGGVPCACHAKRHLNFQTWSEHIVFLTFSLRNVLRATRAWIFGHLNFQTWSGLRVFCTFWLRNVLRATTACNFSTSQLQKVVRTWCAFYILTWKSASRHNGVQFFISHLPSGLRTRRFSEPSLEPQIMGKTTALRDFPTFSRTWIFFLLRLSLFWSSFISSSLLISSLTLPTSAFHLSILSEVWLLIFLRIYIYIPMVVIS